MIFSSQAGLLTLTSLAGLAAGALVTFGFLRFRTGISRPGRRLPAILNAIADAVFLLDPDSGRILDVNRGTCELFRCSRDKILGKPLADLGDTPPANGAENPLDWIRKARTEGPQRFVWRVKRQSGGAFWAEASLRIARIGGRARGLMTARDITARRNTEAELLESTKRFRTLIDTVPDLAIHGYLMDGTAVYWNETCTRLYGYTAEEALGRNLVDLIIPPELKEAVHSNIKAMKLGATSLPPAELVLQRKDSSRVHVYSGYAVSSLPGHPPQFFCMDIDLTERIRSEGERQQLQDQLAQAQKMELVGRLAGGVAHDFNNMLGVIVGYTELAMEQADPTGNIFHDLQEIRKAAYRSTDLTRQLLAYARKQPVSPRVLDLNDAIGGAINMIRRLIGEDLKLVWQPAPSLWPIRMDPVQIDQILANLCVNARDAIHGVGQLLIQTGTVTITDAPRSPGLGPGPGDYVWITVGDDGPGMPPEVLDHIFEPFFTTKGIGRGTGLGLATVYGIVQQNNGFIQVKSVPGRGTTFTIHFPRHRGPAGPAVEPVVRVPDVGHNQTLLLVEDEPSLLTLCQSYLQRIGYTVLATSSPAEAIHLADFHSTPIDLLITDVVMPEMDGAELSHRLTLRHPTLKTLFMSGYTADVIALHGVLQDGVHFLQKPFSNSDLAAKIQSVLTSKSRKEPRHEQR